MADGTVTSPRGFLAGGVSCGIKRSGRRDVGMIVCPTGARAAAVFTTNKVVSAAVTVCRRHVASREIDAVIVNSGNANACTGKRGIDNAVTMCRETGKLIDSPADKVLVASTGIIGEQMPMEKVKKGISAASEALSASPEAGLAFAEAIMTTDTVAKQACRKVKIGSATVTIAGTIKGAGMIGPNMATTLCFITTDAAITKALLARALKDAIGDTVNKLTVDGHQSTNDTAIILASALAGNRPIKAAGADFKRFCAGLGEVLDDLARQMALDAEGATRMFKVVVTGAATKADARKAARAVADYDLVKCAVNGGDPNWGRIICAVGSVGVKLKAEKLSCKLDNITVFRNGAPTRFDRVKASKVVSQREHTITVGLGAGKATDFCYGCDLSRDYVTINADYHT